MQHHLRYNQGPGGTTSVRARLAEHSPSTDKKEKSSAQEIMAEALRGQVAQGRADAKPASPPRPQTKALDVPKPPPRPSTPPTSSQSTQASQKSQPQDSKSSAYNWVENTAFTRMPDQKPGQSTPKPNYQNTATWLPSNTVDIQQKVFGKEVGNNPQNLTNNNNTPNPTNSETRNPSALLSNNSNSNIETTVHLLPQLPGENPIFQGFGQRVQSSLNFSNSMKSFEQGNGNLGGNLNPQDQKPQVQIRAEGKIIVITRGDETMILKKDKNGDLKETHSEGGDGKGLSDGAKSELVKVLKTKGGKDSDGQSSGEAQEIPQELLEQLQAAQEAAAAAESDGDSEVKFLKLLYEVLEQQKKVAKPLGEGEEVIPGEKDWQAFFESLGLAGNVEKTVKKSLDEVLSLLFRGLSEEGYLVGDLKFLKDGKAREEKFAQLQVSEKFKQWLKNLEPGQKINLETLREMFGEELQYLAMAHSQEQVFNMMDGANKNTVFNPKSSVDPYSQARFEQALFNKKAKKTSLLPGDVTQRFENPMPSPGFVAGFYHKLGQKERFEGNPKLYTALSYAAVLITLTIPLIWALVTFL